MDKQQKVSITLSKTKKRRLRKRKAQKPLPNARPNKRQRLVLPRENLTPKYINTLNNPFEHGPVRLGWGTMVPTDLYTAISRFQVTTASDGSFALVMFPTLGGTTAPIWQLAGILTSSTWTNPYGFANAGPIVASADEARVVSGGIKVFPMQPATAAPGIIYAGSLPSLSVSELTSTTGSTFVASSIMRIGYGSPGGCALVHPVDPNSFVFSKLGLNGYTGTQTSLNSVPCIIGSGFQAGISVYVEAVLNVETILSTPDSSSVLTNPEISLDQETLADSFPSIERMWRTIKQYVPNSASVDEAATRIPDVLQALGKASKVYNQVQSARKEYFPDFTPNKLFSV